MAEKAGDEDKASKQEVSLPHTSTSLTATKGDSSSSSLADKAKDDEVKKVADKLLKGLFN